MCEKITQTSTTKMNKKALFVMRYFPPQGVVGAFRPSKFIKYLESYDWEVHVISLPPERQSQLKAHSVDSHRFPKLTEIPLGIHNIDMLFPSIDQSFGDARRIPNLMREIPSIVDENDIDLIFHTAPPFLSLSSVIWLSNKISVPYILDLRDPWYLNSKIFNNTTSVNSRWWSFLNKQLEKSAFKNSDVVILNNDIMKKKYMDKYNNVKFEVITNGYDTEDYQIKKSHSNSKKEGIKIIYPGKFRGGGTEIIKAIELINKSGEDVSFHHYGDENSVKAESIKNKAKEAEVFQMINFNGHINFEELVPELKSADVGLIMTRRNDPTHIPIKTYDYLACNIPIVSICSKKSAVNEILKNYSQYYRVGHNQPHELSKAIIMAASVSPLKDQSQNNDQYMYKSLTEDLVSVFDSVLEVE